MEENKLFALVWVIVGTVAITAIVMTRGCLMESSKSSERVLTECIKSGRPPLECRAALGSAP